MIRLRLPYFKYLAEAMREAYSNNEDVIIDSIFCGELIADAEEQADLEDKNRRLNIENDDLYERTQRLEREISGLEDDIWSIREERKNALKANDELEKKIKKLTTKCYLLEAMLNTAEQNKGLIPVYSFAGRDENSTTATLYSTLIWGQIK